MAENFGSGVSRVLDPTGTQYTEVILQQGKPPLDAEFNLLQELAFNFTRKYVTRGCPSGFLGNETNASSDFITNTTWSNWLKFGPQRSGEQQAILWAVVNGWLVPVTGTRTGTPPGAPDDAANFNVIALDPPPASSGDFRVDYVFLEVWLARIPPNPATLNKPSSSAVWRYGNVEGGYSFLPDDLIDPALGFETSERVQLQYRIRVQKGLVGLTSSPDGFDPAVVKAQGSATAPTSFIFQNMRQVLGDTGLWRAGDGTQNTLGTVDGYSYAIPICCVFRRNGVAWNGDPSPNLNGGFNRNPTAVDRTGILTFSTTPTLGLDLTAAATTAQLVSATNLPLPITPSTSVLIQIGDELMTYTAVTTGVPPTLTGLLRGQNGTRAEAHRAGDTIKVISGRPDGLFADQIAKTDILDLRHLVNPNGFDYTTLLKGSLDKLLRGQLRANWKRTGAGPQGPFVPYQDKIAAGSVALGVTKLDAPDNIRLGFSDAAISQSIEIIAKANSVGVPAPINVAWSLGITATHTTRTTPNQFSPTDVITVPVAQLKAGLPGGDSDQVRWLNDAISGAVVLRIDGQTTPVPSTMYTVTPASPTSTDDLVITLGANFPATTNQVYITVHPMYGPGRGLARRADSIHSVSYINPSTELLLQPQGIPGGNLPTRVGWSLLWSKFRNAEYKRLVPVTAGTYADMGSKSVFLTPFRRVSWPTEFRTIDGTAANPHSGVPLASGAAGSSTGTTTFTDLTANFTGAGVTAGDALVITNGFAPGTYIVQTVAATSLVVDRPIFAGAIPPSTGLVYTVSHAQGIMPLLASDGVTPKWATTDPLQLFCGTTFSTAAQKNIFVTLPRHLVPGWGELNVPILPIDNTVFSEGVNYMSLSKKGNPPFTDGDKNFVPYGNGSLTYGVFSTLDFNPPGTNPAAYNALFTFGGKSYAGMRFFTDTRGLNRQGLELPPFYGVARLFAVYEAGDYNTHGSSYDATTRNFTGAGATNLLRQNMMPGDGPVMWVEIDVDGDSTFILNANALDLARSPTPIASFAAGNYVIEASIFGFDRGSFDLTRDFRLVMTRPSNPTLSWSLVNSMSVDPTVRANNIGTVTGPTGILPGPATNSDQVVVNYSRTPYQGDPWGSQTNYIDITYEPGPLQSGTAFQLVDTHLTETALTRPNQKVLEVLASVGFSTTLGTGRLSGDVIANALDPRNIGYENPASYPPASPISLRPQTLPEAFVNDIVEIGTEYLGATERLPLGALFRDKDFRGGLLTDGYNPASPLVYTNESGLGDIPTGLSVASSLEQDEILLDTSTAASGAPGDAIVQVDGEQSNYSLLVNFRVNRGGSAFTANGGHPGGEVGVTHPSVKALDGHSRVLQGHAYLVRNAVTNVGATEVSAGGELMLLVVTSVQDLKDTAQHAGRVLIGTNGTNEGYAAADLYRIDGHPIVTDNVRMVIDPTTIALSKRVP